MATLHVDAVLKGIHMTFSVTYIIIHILSRMLAPNVASLMQTLQHAVQGKTCKPWKNPSLFKGLAAGPSYLIWQVGTENLPVKKIYWLNLSAAAVSVLFCSCCFFFFPSLHPFILVGMQMLCNASWLPFILPANSINQTANRCDQRAARPNAPNQRLSNNATSRSSRRLLSFGWLGVFFSGEMIKFILFIPIT